MKKYIVENSYDGGNTYQNCIGDYVIAENEIDALEYAKQYVFENTDNSDELKNCLIKIYEITKNELGGNERKIVLTDEIKF